VTGPISGGWAWDSGISQATAYRYLNEAADSGYEGAGAGVHVPVKKPAGGRELDPDTRTRERAAAIPALPGRTRLRADVPAAADPAAVMLSPGTIGDVAKAALVLVQFEHQMIN